MTYNKSEIMTRAWEIKRNNIRRVGKVLTNYNRGSYCTFGECLRMAWAEAKRAAAIEAEAKIRAETEKNAERKYSGCVVIGFGWKDCIEVNTYNGIVTGKTYSWRTILKDFGAVWCPMDRYWALPMSSVQDFCRKYA